MEGIQTTVWSYSSSKQILLGQRQTAVAAYLLLIVCMHGVYAAILNPQDLRQIQRSVYPPCMDDLQRIIPVRYVITLLPG